MFWQLEIDKLSSPWPSQTVMVVPIFLPPVPIKNNQQISWNHQKASNKQIPPISPALKLASLPSVKLILWEKQPSARSVESLLVFNPTKERTKWFIFPLWLMECQSVKLPAAVFGWNENPQTLGPLWLLPAPYSHENAHTNTDNFFFYY